MIAAPIYVLLIRDDEEGGGSSAAIVKAATDAVEAAKILTERVADKQQGIEIRYPDDWHGEKVEGAVRVFSDDDTTGIAVVSKGNASEAPQIFKQSVKSVKRGFKDVQTQVPTRQTPIAGLPAATAALTGTDRRGVSRSALLAVARGRNRAYVITVLSPPGGGGQLEVANLILIAGLKLTD